MEVLRKLRFVYGHVHYFCLIFNQRTLFFAVNLSLMHFNQNIQPFLCQNFKTNYNVVSYDDHGTETVKGHVKFTITGWNNYISC